MAKINKQDVIQKLVDELNLYPGKDLIPTELADKILATYQINTQEVSVKTPTANVVVGVEKTADTVGNNDTTIYTTPATGKFYLTNAAISNSGKSGGTLWNDAQILITVNEVQQKVLSLQSYTADPKAAANTLNLQNPILIDPGTTIVFRIICAYDDQDSYGTANIVGYTE